MQHSLSSGPLIPSAPLAGAASSSLLGWPAADNELRLAPPPTLPHICVQVDLLRLTIAFATCAAAVADRVSLGGAGLDPALPASLLCPPARLVSMASG